MSSDWDHRLLCPDGGCVGVIGTDGTCNVCGRVLPNWGDERRRGKKTTAEVEPVVEAHVIEHDTTAAPDDFDDRALCPDGGCVGLLVDGTCNVCGAQAEEA